MKPSLSVLMLILLGTSACAHNPRPESPEQRAERQAHSLQAQQDAQSDPRSVTYVTREDASDEPRQDEPRQPEQQNDPQQARNQAREQARAIRSSIRSTTMPVYTGVTGITRGILR